MSLNRVALKTLPLARNNVMLNQIRFESVISGPPTFRMSFHKKLLLGGSMICSTLIIPVYVLCNITKWRQEPEE